MRLKKCIPGLWRNMIRYWKFGIRELNSVQVFPWEWIISTPLTWEAWFTTLDKEVMHGGWSNEVQLLQSSSGYKDCCARIFFFFFFEEHVVVGFWLKISVDKVN